MRTERLLVPNCDCPGRSARWALAGVKTDGRAATFEEAKAQFRGSWEAWKAYEVERRRPL
jgi:hypothetical protein